ncbi:hypothetical protein AB6E53_02260 [Vibrio breoganii]|uniref:Uncharacterized protein n=1 Tax=Vibrio breoganii TaxID=553239 RepID=A0AAP8SWR8_9VIBR|nr:hypothetical protein [Vibrio breoganii]PMP10210.1 hypothetical protein BCS93_11080 [Vibrio breoganii]
MSKLFDEYPYLAVDTPFTNYAPWEDLPKFAGGLTSTDYVKFEIGGTEVYDQGIEAFTADLWQMEVILCIDGTKKTYLIATSKDRKSRLELENVGENKYAIAIKDQGDDNVGDVIDYVILRKGEILELSFGVGNYSQDSDDVWFYFYSNLRTNPNVSDGETWGYHDLYIEKGFSEISSAREANRYQFEEFHCTPNMAIGKIWYRTHTNGPIEYYLDEFDENEILGDELNNLTMVGESYNPNNNYGYIYTFPEDHV